MNVTHYSQLFIDQQGKLLEDADTHHMVDDAIDSQTIQKEAEISVLEQIKLRRLEYLLLSIS